MDPERGRRLSIAVLLGSVAIVALAILAQALVQPVRERPLPPPGAAAPALPSPGVLAPGEVRLLAAGDVADCGGDAAATTAAAIRSRPDATVLALGDLAYPAGAAADFRDCWGPTWGTATAGRLVAVEGNHDRMTDGGRPFREALGSAAPGTAEAPWTAFDLGGWRIVLLDSECAVVGGCGEGSAQLAWLRAELAAHPARCRLAAWHRPRFSSGPHGDAGEMGPIWDALAGAGTEIVLAAHDHRYERFAPLGAGGERSATGIRSFVVGTGGAPLYAGGRAGPGSVLGDDTHHGLLELVLGRDGYRWRFLAASGDPWTDEGGDECRAAGVRSPGS